VRAPTVLGRGAGEGNGYAVPASASLAVVKVRNAFRHRMEWLVRKVCLRARVAVQLWGEGGWCMDALEDGWGDGAAW
jgi:hypothetical protein